MNEYEKLWDQRAQFFDTDYSDYDMDLEFFGHYFDPRKTVCELGCGTLRIARLLSGQYKKYYGVDISREMLSNGLKLLPESLRDQVIPIHSAMQDFEFPEKVDLVFSMGNSFLMISDPLKMSVLQNIRNNLAIGGRFVLEIYNPNRWRALPQNQFIHLRTILIETNKYVTLSYTQSMDEQKKTNSVIWLREEVDNHTREVLKNVFPIEFHYLEYQDIQDMLAGYFQIEEIFGSFEKAPFVLRDSKRMIFVCGAQT